MLAWQTEWPQAPGLYIVAHPGTSGRHRLCEILEASSVAIVQGEAWPLTRDSAAICRTRFYGPLELPPIDDVPTGVRDV